MPGVTRPVQGGAYSGPRSEPGGQNTPRAGRFAGAIGAYGATIGQFAQQVNQGDIFDDVADVASIVIASGSGVEGYLTDYDMVIDVDNPVSHWKLGDSTVTAIDRKGVHDLPAANGPIATTAGIVDKNAGGLANAFVAASIQRFDLVAVSDGRGLPYDSNTLTIEAWIKPIRSQTAYVCARNVGGRLSVLSSGNLRLDVTIGGVNTTVDSPSGQIVAGNRYHVAGVYDGTAVIVYINGVEVARKAATGVVPSQSAYVPVIGSQSGGGSEFDGIIDEVVWYNTGLSAVRVAAHAQAGQDDAGSGVITVSGSGYESSSIYEEVLDQDVPTSHWRLGTDMVAYDRRRVLDLPAVSGPIGTSSGLVAGSDFGSTFSGTQRFGFANAANRGLPYEKANWTVEAWIKPTTLATTQYAVYRANCILQMAGSSLRADVQDAASVTKVVSLKSGAQIGVSYHAVITYDGTNLIGYLNGVEVSRTPMTGTASAPNEAPTIGSRSDGVVPFTGTVDDISWYSTALSAPRVLAHFQAGNTGDSGTGTITASGTGVRASSYADAGTVAITASGIGTESGTYTDSGSGTVTASGSGVEQATYGDISNGTVTASGIGTEAYNSVDSGSGTITTSGSRVEQAIYVDISSGTVTVNGIGTEFYSYVDSGSGTVTASGLGTESYSYSDSRSGTVTASGSGTESYQIAYFDSGSGTITASGIGTESYQVAYIDSGSGTVTTSGSGTESYQVVYTYTDSGSGTITASGSGVESYQPTYADIASGTVIASGVGTESYSDIDSGSGTIASSGTKVESSSYADSGSGTVNSSGTGFDARVYPDISTGTISVIGTGSDTRVYADTISGTIAVTGTSSETAVYSASSVGTSVIDGTGLDSEVYDDASSGTTLISGTGVESYEVLIGYADASSGQIDVNGTSVESYSHTSTAIDSLIVDGTSEESYSHTGTAIGSLLINGTRVETQSHSSTATGFVFVDGTASETYTVINEVFYTDISEGIITSTGTRSESVSYSHSATGSIKSTGTSVDSVYYSNTTAGEITLLGSGVESKSYEDASFGISVLTGSAHESYTYTKPAQPGSISTVVALNPINVVVVNKTPIRSVVTSTKPIGVQIALQRTVKVGVTKLDRMKVLATNR